jgi:hypothetical protein
MLGTHFLLLWLDLATLWHGSGATWMEAAAGGEVPERGGLALDRIEAFHPFFDTTLRSRHPDLLQGVDRSLHQSPMTVLVVTV